MKELYEKSILVLGRLNQLPTWKEWNKIAKKKTLMSYNSIKTFGGQNFNLIYRDARIKEEKRNSNKNNE